MSSNIRELTDKLCDEMGIERSKDCFGVVDNGEKQPRSILSKVKREVYSGNTDYSLGQLNDLSRCALIVNSYSEIPQIVQSLNKIYPELVGHVTRRSAGYIGIHLNFKINNIPIEVQVSTNDAWLVKQASEHVYRKHRDFEAEIPVRLSMIKNEKDNYIREKMIADLKSKMVEYKKDYGNISNLYEELHKTTDLYENLPIIETMFLSLEINQGNTMKQYFDYDNILEQRLTDDSGIVNDMLVLNYSENINSIIKGIQEQVVSDLENIVGNLNKSKDFEMNDMQKFVYTLREYYINSVHDELKKLNGENCWNNYQNFIMKNINKTIIKSALTIPAQCPITNYENLRFILSQHNSALDTLGCIGDTKQFALRLIEMSHENEEMEKLILSKEEKCIF